MADAITAPTGNWLTHTENGQTITNPFYNPYGDALNTAKRNLRHA